MTAVGQQPMGAGSGGAMLVAPVKGTNQWDQGLLGCCGDFKTSKYIPCAGHGLYLPRGYLDPNMVGTCMSTTPGFEPTTA